VVLAAAVHVVAAVMAVLAAIVLIVVFLVVEDLTEEAHTVEALMEEDMVVVDNKSLKNIR
jgi:hypothetical protein